MWPLPPAEKADAIEPAEKTEPTDPAEPIENADPNEPTLPIDSAEPVEPIESTDPLLAIDRTESRESGDSAIGPPFGIAEQSFYTHVCKDATDRDGKLAAAHELTSNTFELWS
jgi:hypothetical protein